VQVDVQGWSSGFDRLAEQMREMLDEVHGRNYFRSHASETWRPRLNLYETPENFLVCAELAGMPRERIEVRAEQGMLHIQGTRERPRIPDEAQPGSSKQGAVPGDVSVHLMEIDSGPFHRRVPIGSDVIVEKISAVYLHGYLWVIMPRAISPDDTG
jgi:HSP20 family protein